jgi:hypothetical protein
MADADQPPDELAQSLSTAQLEKLKLEIEKLKVETSGLKDKKKSRINLIAYSPMLSVLIAVSGFLFGVWQYYNQQQKARINEQTDQRLKVQTQIRDDLNRILKFPEDKDMTLSQIGFLLNDIDRLLKVNIGGTETEPATLQNGKKNITLNLTHLILGDCNFDRPRDAELGQEMLDQWEDCGTYLKNNKNKLRNMLGKYTDALAQLHDQAPRYISGITYNQAEDAFDEPPGASETEKSHFRHFETLVNGFSNYLKLCEDDKDFKAKAIKDFQASICNGLLTQQEFGISFDPATDPTVFADCQANEKKK